jgi:hypothetical protein
MIYRRIMKNNYFLEKMVNERIERERGITCQLGVERILEREKKRSERQGVN